MPERPAPTIRTSRCSSVDSTAVNPRSSGTHLLRTSHDPVLPSPTTMTSPKHLWSGDWEQDSRRCRGRARTPRRPRRPDRRPRTSSRSPSRRLAAPRGPSDRAGHGPRCRARARGCIVLSLLALLVLARRRLRGDRARPRRPPVGGCEHSMARREAAGVAGGRRARDVGFGAQPGRRGGSSAG